MEKWSTKQGKKVIPLQTGSNYLPSKDKIPLLTALADRWLIPILLLTYVKSLSLSLSAAAAAAATATTTATATTSNVTHPIIVSGLSRVSYA